MADETTPLLPSEPERRSSCAGIGSVLSLLPAVVLMNVHHGFQNIVPLLFDPTLRSTISHSSVVIGFLSALLSTPFWTALSDRHGRRMVLLISLLGAFFPNLAVTLIYHFDLSPFFYLLGVLLEGLLGGFTTFRAVTYAYTAESVSENTRLGIFAMLQGVMTLSFYASQGFSADILKLGEPLTWLLLLLLLPIACHYVFLVVPESLSRLDDQTPEESRDGTHSRLNFILGLAICIQSFVKATEDARDRQQWFDLGVPHFVFLPNFLFLDHMLKFFCVVLVILAVLTLFRPILPFSANQWDLRLSFLCPMTIIVGQPTCYILMALFMALPRAPRECHPFSSVGCVLFNMDLFFRAIRFIVLPILANIGGIALLSFAAGFGPSNNKGLWWGKLSILQSFAEGIFAVLGDQPFVPIDKPDERWDPIFTAYLVYTLHALTAGLVRLFERWKMRVERAQSVP